MPKCSFKNCKNHTSRTLKKDGVSYFRFPRDPVRCRKWTSIVACQRSEKLFKPTLGSVICSKHFLESDEYVTNEGMKRLRKTAVPRIEINDHDAENEDSFDEKSHEQCCVKQKPSPNAGPSKPKRVCRRLQTAASSDSAHKGGDAVTVNTANDVGIYTYHDPEAQAPDQQHNGKRLPAELRCRVCHNHIIGFRYTCVQCADWDMCAGCEARGEHSEHYVLRLPKPKPYAESARVLAAIRREIHELLRLPNEINEISIKVEEVEVPLRLHNEMHEISIKEEPVERPLRLHNDYRGRGTVAGRGRAPARRLVLNSFDELEDLSDSDDDHTMASLRESPSYSPVTPAQLPRSPPPSYSVIMSPLSRNKMHEISIKEEPVERPLRLHNEMYEISIKEEPVEATEEIEIDKPEHNSTLDIDMHDRSVPEVNIHEGRRTVYMNPTEHATRHSQSKGAEARIDKKASRDSKVSRDTEATGHLEASRETDARRNTSPAGDPEQDELDEAVRILRAVKTELYDDPL